MSALPFRFIHASDFHLERPLMGVADVPDHLRNLFLDSPYAAAQRVFDAALAEDVRFVVLAGGIVTPAAGPRGPLFLAEQFARLAEREIAVYWAGSQIDPPEVWPSAVRLPRNVRFFPRGQIESLVVSSVAGPLARLVGTSCDTERPWRPGDFTPDMTGLYTVAVAHGQPDPALLQSRGIHYWALGGRHDRGTPCGSPQIAHYCGTTQGRMPDESGVHGCTLVQVDEQCETRTSLIPTDVVRWSSERVVIDEATTREDLESRLRQRMQTILEASPSTALLISWTVAGRGPLVGLLRHGAMASELLQSLRSDYGYASPAAWSVSLDVELAETLPPEWYEQETIRGDFLRAIRQLQMNPDTPLGLEQYVAESHRIGTVGQVANLSCAKTSRQNVLREAALLGVDLLSGEEPNA
jgi:DNA repair protein SbcD/Mre11